MANVIKALAAVVVLSVGFGCSTTGTGGESVPPTHRWFADTDVSIARYNLHNTQCADETKVDLARMRKAAPEFVAYEQCMNAKGYRLVAAANALNGA